jgi:hypothetical protein
MELWRLLGASQQVGGRQSPSPPGFVPPVATVADRARGTTAGFGAIGSVGQELVMKKILSLIFVASLSLALAAPVYAGRGHGGGFHGGSRGGFHHGFHHGGFHRGCCFGPAFVGGVFVGSVLAYPYYPYYYYPYYSYSVYPEPVYTPAPAVQPQAHRCALEARGRPSSFGQTPRTSRPPPSPGHTT